MLSFTATEGVTIQVNKPLVWQQFVLSNRSLKKDWELRMAQNCCKAKGDTVSTL